MPRYPYRYEDSGYGRITLAPVPGTGPNAVHFCAETYRIANDLFNQGQSGAAFNSVCTAQGGGVIFQHKDPAVNKQRARLVTAVWRRWRYYKVKDCTCRIATVLPDAAILIGGVDDCSVHGMAKEKNDETNLIEANPINHQGQ